jgi:hypothetical protein
VATEAAWLNGKKDRKNHGQSKTLLTRIGLLMEGLRETQEETNDSFRGGPDTLVSGRTDRQ